MDRITSELATVVVEASCCSLISAASQGFPCVCVSCNDVSSRGPNAPMTNGGRGFWMLAGRLRVLDLVIGPSKDRVSSRVRRSPPGPPRGPGDAAPCLRMGARTSLCSGSTTHRTEPSPLEPSVWEMWSKDGPAILRNDLRETESVVGDQHSDANLSVRAASPASQRPDDASHLGLRTICTALAGRGDRQTQALS